MAVVTLADRLIEAVIRQGPMSPAGRILHDIIERAEQIEAAVSDPQAVELAADLADVIERARLAS